MAKNWNYDDKILPEDCTRWDKTSEDVENNLNEMKDELNKHSSDKDIHIDSYERTIWNNKFDSENEQYKKDQQALKDYISSEIDKQMSTWFGTLEEYEALQTKDDKTIYYIHD